MHLGMLPTQIETELRPLRRVLLVGHASPDADCLGSLSAFGSYVTGLGGLPELFCPTPPPAHLRFLPAARQLKTTLGGTYEAAVVLDCGDLTHAQLTPSRLTALGIPLVINIDHHHTNTRFGHLNLVEPSAAATAEILYHFFRQRQVPVTPSVATALLSGILADTGGFQHANTSPTTLRTAAELVSAGASLLEVHRQTFRDKSVSTLQCWGRVLSRLTVNPKSGVAVAIVTRDDLAGQPDEQAAASGLANFLNTLGGIRAVVVLVEQADGTVRGSLRSRDPLLDVSKFATLCGGGGHKLAAGFTVKGRLEQTENGWRVIG